MAMSVSGALKNGEWERSLVGACFDGNGRPLTAKEIKAELESLLAAGVKVIPYGAGCDEFDPVTGCPGHDHDEAADLAQDPPPASCSIGPGHAELARMSDFERWRRYQRMARELAALIPANEQDVERASGLCECERCGLPYFDHPRHEKIAGNVHIACDGRLLHL